MRCTSNQAVLPLGVVLLAVILSTERFLVSASPSQCPVSAAGLPQFVDKIEGRCSPCTTRVCEVYRRSLPEPCICACVTDFPNGDYSETQKTQCERHPPEDSAPPFSYRSTIIWLSCLTPIAVAVAGLALSRLRLRGSTTTRENVPLMPPDHTVDHNVNRTDDTELTATPPPVPAPTPAPGISGSTPSITQGHVIKDSESKSHSVTSPPRDTRVPEQESQSNGDPGHVDIDLDRTPHKSSQSSRGENPAGVPEEGPYTPKEGVPGHDHRLRES
ncbi:uncharacterized protein LOC135461417 [Liolophura sinensis]|uniref:uncharacterized protein LOC135461417 n=1 Tax=Liolophura sinensis TaxID=3198878 RepID=UPI0031585711